MSEEYTEAEGDYGPQDGKPGSPADRSAKTAVPDSFPASDPVATTPAVGVRAMELGAMMDETPPPEPADATPVAARFPDMVTAKLALEKLVRAIPLDRQAATLTEDGAEVVLTFNAPGADMARIREVLSTGGDTGQPG
jgi:hypothetical protein